MRCRCSAVVRRRHLSRCGARAAAIGASGAIAHFLRGAAGDWRRGCVCLCDSMANIYGDTVRWRERKRLLSSSCIHLMEIFFMHILMGARANRLDSYPNRIYGRISSSCSETGASPPSEKSKLSNGQMDDSSSCGKLGRHNDLQR